MLSTHPPQQSALWEPWAAPDADDPLPCSAHPEHSQATPQVHPEAAMAFNLGNVEEDGGDVPVARNASDISSAARTSVGLSYSRAVFRDNCEIGAELGPCDTWI